MFNPCVIIPIYNNEATIRGVVESLAGLDLDCLIVDDGSNSATQRVLGAIERESKRVEVLRRAANGGKGAAMAQGFRAAFEKGYTHAVQMDADGQHRAADAPRMLEQARRFPGALILGRPVFGDDAPGIRRYGRWVTHFWVCLETLSFDIKDALCGYRCYPLEPVVRLYEKVQIGAGMVFDTEIAVRLYWDGVPMVNVDTPVRYTRDGVSHFRYGMDNLRLARLHTMLVFGMLRRFPTLLFRTRGVPAVKGVSDDGLDLAQDDRNGDGAVLELGDQPRSVGR